MKTIHLALILFIMLIWGFNFVVIKVGLGAIPPVFLVFSRFFLTSLPAVFFVKKPNVSFKMLCSYGIVMFVLQFSMLFIAIHTGITPTLASILLQVQVFFSLILGARLFKEKIHKSQILGACIACSGILLIVRNLGEEVSLPGLLLVLGAAACSAPGNVLSKKMGNVDIIGVVVWSSLFAWPFLLAFSLFYEGKERILQGLSQLSWHSGGSILYITYLSTFFGFYCWNYLLSKYPLSKIAPFSLLSPIFGTIASTWILKEPLQGWKIFAGCLVITGLCINLIGPKLEKILTSLPSKSDS